MSFEVTVKTAKGERLCTFNLKKENIPSIGDKASFMSEELGHIAVKVIDRDFTYNFSKVTDPFDKHLGKPNVYGCALIVESLPVTED
jgi:hypothetical protein